MYLQSLCSRVVVGVVCISRVVVGVACITEAKFELFYMFNFLKNKTCWWYMNRGGNLDSKLVNQPNPN